MAIITRINAINTAGAVSSQERGFSLLEVMIALLVLSIGLLGIAGLQVFSLKYNHQSYERTQATLLINEIVDRMRANPAAVQSGLYDNVPLANAYGTYIGFGSCPTTCSSTDLFNYDVYEWKKRMQDPGMLASGQGGVALDPATGLYVITVSWTEDDVTPTQMAMVRIF
jgi:type IV pilus assembly protein PilV